MGVKYKILEIGKIKKKKLEFRKSKSHVWLVGIWKFDNHSF